MQPLSKKKNYNTAYKREYRARMSFFQNQNQTFCKESDSQTEALQNRVINLTLREQKEKQGKFQ